jgi:hypothetical protein
MSLWTDLGFRDNPYSTTPIRPTRTGARLLVGREKPLRRLIRGITSADTLPTVEGDNGVGKTSLVAVAGYDLLRAFDGKETTQLFLSLPDAFQLLPTDNLIEFRRRVYYAVARAFIEQNKRLKLAGLSPPDTDDVERWLQAPVIKAGGGGIQVLGSGANVDRSAAINEGEGFRDDGFQATIDGWLAECFPSRELGGFICLIDNLELLETSQAARRQLEALRDSMLNRPGLRWVLCGARGIVRSAASSARLHGVLSDPIELGPLSDAMVSEAINRRIKIFASHGEVYAPVNTDGFTHIYRVLNRNLRDALKYCEDYSLWLDEQGERPDNYNARWELLESWLADRAQRFDQATRTVKERA